MKKQDLIDAVTHGEDQAQPPIRSMSPEEIEDIRKELTDPERSNTLMFNAWEVEQLLASFDEAYERGRQSMYDEFVAFARRLKEAPTS